MFPDYDSYSYEETLPDDHRRLRHLDQSGSFRIDGRRHESTHFSHERPVLEEVPLPEYEVIHQDGAAVSAAFRPWMRDQPAESVDSYPPSDNPRSDNPPSDYPRASCTPSSHPSDVECCAPVPRRMPLPTHTMAPDASSSSSEVRRPNFDPAWYARPGLSVEEVEDYKQAFDVFDVQGRGRVDPLELRRTLLSLSQDHRNSTLYMILAEVEKYTKPIGFEDFLNIMTQKVLNASGFTSRQDVSRIFRLFDDDNTGTVSLTNLQRMCKTLGERLSITEMKEMIKRADTSRTGEVSLEDFYSILTRRVI